MACPVCFGMKIRKLRQNLRLSQTDLAISLNTSQSRICRIESGKVNVTHLEMKCIHKVFNVNDSHFAITCISCK